MDLKPNQELIDLIADIDLFDALNDDERSELASMMEKHSYEANTEVFREGDPGGQMLIIADGTVEVQKMRSHGSGRVVIARFERTGIIGEMSLIDNMPRSATVVVVQPTTVYTLTRESLEEMMLSRKDLSIKLLKGLAQLISLRLRNTSGWFADVF